MHIISRFGLYLLCFMVAGPLWALPPDTVAFHPLKGTVRALVVGISNYQSPAIPALQHAANDALAFATWLQSPAGNNLRSDQVVLLTNADATLGSITSALDWLTTSAQEDDLTILYFAGQAAVRAQEVFWLPCDAQPNDFRASSWATGSAIRTLGDLAVAKKSRVLMVANLVLPGKTSAANAALETISHTLTEANLPESCAGMLSCQPREVAWKNAQTGLGLITQHGLEGLYGLADGNADNTITHQEIRQYFDQKQVSETLPVALNWWGTPNWVLARVQPDYLEKLLFYKNRLDTNDNSNAALLKLPADTPPERVFQYAAFRETLLRTDLIEPSGYSAWDLYTQLTPEQGADKLGKRMRRELCAALQDEAQQALNALLSDDPYEINTWRYNPKQYHQYPEYLRRALLLLGPSHYLSEALNAKKLYFEAHSLSHNNPDLTRSPAAAEAAKQRAKAKLREALTYQPDAAYLYHAAGYLHFGDYSLDSFMYYYTRAIELSPTWIVPYLDIGQKYMNVFVDLKMAERWFKKALAIKPDSYSALEKLAWLYQWHFDMSKAIEICQQMIALRPDLPNGFSTLGDIYLAAKSYAQAEYYANEALKIDPDYTWSYTDLGIVYLRTNRFDQGRAHFEKALARPDISPEYRTNLLRLLAEAQIENGWYAEALATLDRGAQVPSADFLWEDANRESLRGRALAITGQYAQADSVLRRALTIDATPNPYYVSAFAYLGEALAGMGRPDSARVCFDQAIAYEAKTRLYGYLYADAHYRYGLYYQRRGQNTAAKAQFRRAIKADPAWYAGYYGMACLLARRGRHALAMDYLERALLRYYPNRHAIDTEPAFDNIRSKPRFKQLLQRFFDHQKP